MFDIVRLGGKRDTKQGKKKQFKYKAFLTYAKGKRMQFNLQLFIRREKRGFKKDLNAYDICRLVFYS